MKRNTGHNRTEFPPDFSTKKKENASKQEVGYKKLTAKEFIKMIQGPYPLKQWEESFENFEDSEEKRKAEEEKIYEDFERIYTPEVTKEIKRNLEKKAREGCFFVDKYGQHIEGIDAKKYLKRNKIYKEIDEYCKLIKEIDAKKYIEANDLRRKKRIEEQREVSKHLDEVLGPKDLTH